MSERPENHEIRDSLLCYLPSSSSYYCYLTHSFILRKEEAPVCVACSAVITVKHILIECADLLEIRRKYFEEKSLYSLFRNVIPEISFRFLARNWCVLQNKKCVKVMFV